MCKVFLLRLDAFVFSPASNQPHPGEFHVCFALGANFDATSRGKCPHLRSVPLHRREAVERELSAGGGNKGKLQTKFIPGAKQTWNPHFQHSKHKAKNVAPKVIPVYKHVQSPSAVGVVMSPSIVSCDVQHGKDSRAGL